MLYIILNIFFKSLGFELLADNNLKIKDTSTNPWTTRTVNSTTGFHHIKIYITTMEERF